MEPIDYITVIYDALSARHLTSSGAHFSTHYMGSASKSYYSTCRARGAIGPGSLVHMLDRLETESQHDLARLVETLLRRRHD